MQLAPDASGGMVAALHIPPLPALDLCTAALDDLFEFGLYLACVQVGKVHLLAPAARFGGCVESCDECMALAICVVDYEFDRRVFLGQQTEAR